MDNREIYSLIISFIIGWLFWYLSKYFADYDDYPNYNIVLTIYALFMIVVLMRILNLDYKLSILGFISGQSAYLCIQCKTDSKNSILSNNTLIVGLITLSIIVTLFSVSLELCANI